MRIQKNKDNPNSMPPLSVRVSLPLSLSLSLCLCLSLFLFSFFSFQLHRNNIGGGSSGCSSSSFSGISPNSFRLFPRISSSLVINHKNQQQCWNLGEEKMELGSLQLMISSHPEFKGRLNPLPDGMQLGPGGCRQSGSPRWGALLSLEGENKRAIHATASLGCCTLGQVVLGGRAQ